MDELIINQILEAKLGKGVCENNRMDVKKIPVCGIYKCSVDEFCPTRCIHTISAERNL